MRERNGERGIKARTDGDDVCGLREEEEEEEEEVEQEVGERHCVLETR